MRDSEKRHCFASSLKRVFHEVVEVVVIVACAGCCNYFMLHSDIFGAGVILSGPSNLLT